ncbi:putative F-box/FBD/LRR-repeat protein At5g44950 [Miscanthus floridulus]|uniref:putative F-box/FBD/LRR-repeat protein At5g44950 n=1 Tax=Miscanthus floridulus TaxID=154761 RepID=UPI003458F7AA
MAMGVVTRAQRRRLEEEERLADRISSLPDGVLGDIVSLLPTKAGARTQVLSSRWRHIWRSVPLNIDLHIDDPERHIPVKEISRVLSVHPGPGRRFSIPRGYLHWIDDRAATMDGWLRSPALENLQELDLNSYSLQHWSVSQPLLPPSVHRFSSTLRVASFNCLSFPAGTNAKALHLPLLKQLALLQLWLPSAANSVP